MLRDGELRAEHVWKRFRADRQRMLLRDQVDRLTRRMRGQLDTRHRMVLRDINFHAEPGESVGLVGANGSGKSTLLKLLTRVMYPYAGSVSTAGRVGALIEVRAGISPDLTGRENIFVYGSLLGLPRREVARRFDDIVDFAEIPDAIDRQVKFYSSGMQMRLGFAVAAFLEPDILLVDEVLAVGDASFQQKCLQRMREVLSAGTTLVFVSHDLAAVEATCNRGIWLDQGELQEDGPVSDVLASYRQAVEEAAELNTPVDGVVQLLKAEVRGPANRVPMTSKKIIVTLVLDAPWATQANIVIGVSQGTATPIFVLRRDENLRAGETEVVCEIEHLPLPRGNYCLWVGILDRKGDILPWHPARRFEVSGPALTSVPKAIVRLAPLHLDSKWRVVAR
jgi:ABC-type polysaccharide/polyol phosphate transport system ATPase subunit